MIVQIITGIKGYTKAKGVVGLDPLEYVKEKISPALGERLIQYTEHPGYSKIMDCYSFVTYLKTGLVIPQKIKGNIFYCGSLFISYKSLEGKFSKEDIVGFVKDGYIIHWGIYLWNDFYLSKCGRNEISVQHLDQLSVIYPHDELRKYQVSRISEQIELSKLSVFCLTFAAGMILGGITIKIRQKL